MMSTCVCRRTALLTMNDENIPKRILWLVISRLARHIHEHHILIHCTKHVTSEPTFFVGRALSRSYIALWFQWLNRVCLHLSQVLLHPVHLQWAWYRHQWAFLPRNWLAESRLQNSPQTLHLAAQSMSTILTRRCKFQVRLRFHFQSCVLFACY